MSQASEMFIEQREYEHSLEHQLLHLEPTKANIETAANQMVSAIKEGEVDQFELLVRMEAVKSFCDLVRKGAEQFTRQELEKYGKDGYKALQAKFEMIETGVRYNYNNDPVWAALNKQLTDIAEKMKEQEAFLKVLTKPLNEADLETGDIIERVPPSKTSKSSFKITLASK